MDKMDKRINKAMYIKESIINPVIKTRYPSRKKPKTYNCKGLSMNYEIGNNRPRPLINAHQYFFLSYSIAMIENAESLKTTAQCGPFKPRNKKPQVNNTNSTNE